MVPQHGREDWEHTFRLAVAIVLEFWYKIRGLLMFDRYRARYVNLNLDLITIRDMRRRDVAPIRALEVANNSDPWSLDQISKFLGIKGMSSDCLVLEVNDRIVGYLFGSHGKRYYHLENLTIDEPSRRAGLGSRLLHFCLDQCVPSVYDVVLCSLNERDIARQLFLARNRQHPFRLRRTRKGYYGGDDAYVMERKLKSGDRPIATVRDVESADF